MDEGKPCPCLRCVVVPNDDPNLPVLCRDCRHMESAHPPPVSSMGVLGLLGSYKDVAKMSGLRPSQMKATRGNAQLETNSGLKRKAESSGSSKVKKAKGKVCLLIANCSTCWCLMCSMQSHCRRR